jgi:hypothetical protein
MAQAPDEPERPRFEPEIIPPRRGGGHDDRGPAGGPAWPPPPFGFTQAGGTQRFYVRKVGPFGFALLMLVVGLLVALMLLILIGTALLWIPVIAVLAVIAAFSGLFRRR